MPSSQSLSDAPEHKCDMPECERSAVQINTPSLMRVCEAHKDSTPADYHRRLSKADRWGVEDKAVHEADNK